MDCNDCCGVSPDNATCTTAQLRFNLRRGPTWLRRAWLCVRALAAALFFVPVTLVVVLVQLVLSLHATLTDLYPWLWRGVVHDWRLCARRLPPVAPPSAPAPEGP